MINLYDALGCPDYIKTDEEFIEYNKKREYLKTFQNNGNKLYTYEAIKIILHLFSLEEAKAIINGKEINPKLASNETFANLLKIIKKEDTILLEEIFNYVTDFVFINTKRGKIGEIEQYL